MQYRGSGLPLVRLEDRLHVDVFEPAGEELFVVIPRVATHAAGILAREVIDTVHAELRVEREARDAPAISGRAVIAGRLTLFLDPGLLLAAPEVGAA